MEKKRKGKKTIKIPNIHILVAIVAIIAIIAVICIALKSKTKTVFTPETPEMSRTQSYNDVLTGDNRISDENGDNINVLFDAFFLTDKDGDGIADSIRGTCNEVGASKTLYMDLTVFEGGHIKDAVITINADNFYFYTNLVQDTEIAENYLAQANTKQIKLNEISQQTEKVIIGYVRSGDYSSTSSKTSAIGNDTSKYSSEANNIVFSGTYVNEDGSEVSFSKQVYFSVDWYGEVNCGITTSTSYTTSSVSYTDITSFVKDDGFTLNFNLATTESLNQLILASSEIYGVMPELNGYLPTNVKISGTNLSNYSYDKTTGEYTAERVATINNDIVTTNAYTSSYLGTRYNSYSFTVTYPLEAYEALGTPDEISSFQLTIPVNAVNTGYNNPNTEDGFVNPYISNTATKELTITWYKYVAYTATDFNIWVGTYMSTPYYDYVVTKTKPLNIYNGMSSEETDDTYLVKWEAVTGTNGKTDGIIMSETSGKTDNFYKSDGTYVSMEEVTTNVGIYFSGAGSTLGDDGWIKVYDEDTGGLIETFTSSNWNQYTSSNPYKYSNYIKHIRVETSATNALSYFYVYNIKELDDEYITNTYTREEFDSFTRIYSYLSGSMIIKTEDENGETVTSNYYTENPYRSALYEAPTSIADFLIVESTISTQVTAENEKITISTVTTGANEQKWKNGKFLVQLPENIIYAEINSVKTSNESVKVEAYDIYENGGNYYIKIITSNDVEANYSITIDCNLTADPRKGKTTGTLKLWAKNEIACDYRYSGSDEYDLDGNLDTTESVNYRTISLVMDPGSSLTTTETGSNYGDGTDDEVIAPRVAKTSKGEKEATITISATNNYSDPVKDINILGVVPFEGNKYVISGSNLGSTFSTTMTSDGISTTDTELATHTKIYYSKNENPDKDLTNTSNGWIESSEMSYSDWAEVKTYLIVIDTEYSMSSGKTISYSYDFVLPDGVDYNETTYSEHAIYFALATEDGLYYTSTGSARLGFMIAKQYDLEIIKYQKNTEKLIEGVTFAVTEDGAESSSIASTNAEGVATVSSLYAERYYTIKEISTTDDYILSEEEIRFYTKTEIQATADGGEIEVLYIVYVDAEGNYIDDLSSVYETVRDANAISPSSGEDYKVQIAIENEVMPKIEIYKTDENGDALKNVRFLLNGKGKDNKLYTTDANGQISISGLYLGEEYVLSEVKATNYYVIEDTMKFTIVDEGDGSYSISNFETAEDLPNYSINIGADIDVDENYIPVLTIDMQNEKIPTYSIKLTKYAEGEKDEEGNDKVLQNAQYLITGEGIKTGGKIYTTDENGEITIDGLYEYVEGKYITGEYTLYEIYAPEGYAVDNTPLKFKAYREDGELQLDIISGDSIIRTITTTNEETEETVENLDWNIENATTDNAVIKLGIEDSQIFSLFKFYSDENKNRIPLEGVQFVIAYSDDTDDEDGYTPVLRFRW